MPHPVPVVSRRRVLVGGAALAMFGAVAPACGSHPSPPAVDELESQLTLAHHDSELATAAAAALPRSHPALTEIASERSQHAQALATEIARVAGPSATTSSQTTSPTTTSGAAASPQLPPPSLSDVINSLHASADSAAALAAASSGYRAGLLGSIAAACTAAYTVALVVEEPHP